MAENAGILLKGQCTKFSMLPLTLGSRTGRAEWTGTEARGEGSRGGAQKVATIACAESFPPAEEAIFLRQTSAMRQFLPGGRQLTHSIGNTLPNGAEFLRPINRLRKTNGL